MPGQRRAFTISFQFWIKNEILLWINRGIQRTSLEVKMVEITNSSFIKNDAWRMFQICGVRFLSEISCADHSKVNEPSEGLPVPL